MWLALRFMHWPLDARRYEDSDTARVVVTAQRQRQRIVAACPIALSAGIRLGMDLADARLRLGDLQVLDRETAAERAALSRLAGWAWGYSDEVHWALADEHIECSRLVLEIGASLKLFQGRQRLLSSIKRDLSGLGYRYRAGLGDSPQAALAFARADTATKRHGQLGALPVQCLDLAQDAQSTLAASGITHTDALLCLPPATLAHRFGRGLLDELARLQGRRPHGLSLYSLPPRYDTRHELFGAIDNTQGLVFFLRRVFDELAAFLKGADSAIQTLRLTLIHEDEQTTRFLLKLSAPSHDARHLQRVAQERLARVSLAAPVLAIGLTSDRLRRMAHDQGRLWAMHAEAAEAAWPGVLDRIRARLGHDAVSWIHARADHRPGLASYQSDRPAPEDATHRIEPDQPIAPRPIWMLEVPEPVAPDQAWLFHWVSGPERIESGWWDSGQRRDYYRVMDDSGRLLWVFRDLGTARADAGGYYVHGLFG